MPRKSKSDEGPAIKRKASTTEEKKPAKRRKVKDSIGVESTRSAEENIVKQSRNSGITKVNNKSVVDSGNGEKVVKKNNRRKKQIAVKKTAQNIKVAVDSGSSEDEDYKPSKATDIVKGSPRPKRKAPKKKPAQNGTSLRKKSAAVREQEIKKELKAEAALLADDNKAAASSSSSAARQKMRIVPTKFVGAHTSISGGLENAVYEAIEIGARAFALFLKSQRQWASKPLDPKAAEKFRQTCQEHNFSPCHIVPHGSYLMNCASPKEETLRKSREMLTDELKRCEMMGLTLFNFHPGSTCGEISVEEGIQRIADSINAAHKQTKFVTAVLENMCRQGHTIGGHFEELAGIIDKVKDKSRVGVCLDTCHTFAAGYDIKTKEGYKETMEKFHEIVGFNYLKAVHINDSVGELGCHRDRHANIGKGKIGLEGFRNIMNDPRFDNIPFVLETPQTAATTYQREIKTLLKLCTDGNETQPISKKGPAVKKEMENGE